MSREIKMDGEVPILDAMDAEDAKRLHAILTDEPYGGDRSRPYLGQSWTGAGERGMTEVKGLTMRDVGDCIRRAQELSKQPEDRIDYDEIAVVQNALCEIEKMMGIFPNVPKLERK